MLHMGIGSFCALVIPIIKNWYEFVGRKWQTDALFLFSSICTDKTSESSYIFEQKKPTFSSTENKSIK